MMEKNLSLQLDDLMNESSVTGVICTDVKGLSLAAKGIAKPTSSGAISSIANHASKLFPNQESPVICIESDNSNLLIRQQDKIVLGIYKNKE